MTERATLAEGAGRIELKDVHADTMIRLDIAARLKFPDGSIKLSSLRREARRGNLAVWRVANKDMTTLAELDRMLARCRVKGSPPDCGSVLPKEPDLPSGSSLMADGNSAQAAARMRAEKLRASYASTSPASMTSRRAAGVSLTRPR